MSTTFYFRYYDTQPDKQQPEGSRNQTKAAQRADLLHNNRSAANSLAQTIDAASSSTEEAKVESTVSPPPCTSDGADQKAAGEPTPLSAPQAGIFRSGPRATRFAAAALLSSLGSRSCCSQQRSSSTACRSRACFSHKLVSGFLRFFCYPAGRGGGRGAQERRGRDGGEPGSGASHAPRAAPGGARHAPTGHP